MDKIIDGAPYKTGRLNAFQQFHVTRRLAPILGTLVQALGAQAAEEVSKKDMMLLMFTPVADALSSMSDEDTNYILNTCLRVCQRQQPGGWADVLSPQGALMFQDIDMACMLQLTVAVIQENLGNFFRAPLGSSEQPVTP